MSISPASMPSAPFCIGRGLERSSKAEVLSFLFFFFGGYIPTVNRPGASCPHLSCAFHLSSFHSQLVFLVTAIFHHSTLLPVTEMLILPSPSSTALSRPSALRWFLLLHTPAIYCNAHPFTPTGTVIFPPPINQCCNFHPSTHSVQLW